MRIGRYTGSANAYLFRSILIDAPAGIRLPDARQVVLTHEHCDHFAGLKDLDVVSSAGEFCRATINDHLERFGFCERLGLEFPFKKIDRVLSEGSVVEGDGCSLEVFETPGHSKGSICLYESDQRILFSGDTVFGHLDLPNCSLPTSEPAKLMDSYEKLASLDIETIYPGHGDEIKEEGYVGLLLKMLKHW